MKPLSMLLVALALVLAACSNNPPSDEQIKAYLNKQNNSQQTTTTPTKSATQIAQEEREARRARTQLKNDRAAIQEGIDHSQSEITVRQIELDRERTRIFRKYTGGDVLRMTNEITAFKRDINQLNSILGRGDATEIGDAADQIRARKQ